jgi:DUF971 family protein
MSALLPDTPMPTELRLRTASRMLEIRYSDGRFFELSFEFLRVHSPSAEVQGHGPGQETLQLGKQDVQILSLEPVGVYAVQPRFSDGHDTGIYSWQYLYELGLNRDRLWAEYQEKLRAAGGNIVAGSASPTPQGGGCGGGGCGHHH